MCVIGGHNVNNLRYADDAVLISNTEEDLQRLLNVAVEASNRQGLTLNCKKRSAWLSANRLASSVN